MSDEPDELPPWAQGVPPLTVAQWEAILDSKELPDNSEVVSLLLGVTPKETLWDLFSKRPSAIADIKLLQILFAERWAAEYREKAREHLPADPACRVVPGAHGPHKLAARRKIAVGEVITVYPAYLVELMTGETANVAPPEMFADMSDAALQEKIRQCAVTHVIESLDTKGEVVQFGGIEGVVDPDGMLGDKADDPLPMPPDGSLPLCLQGLEKPDFGLTEVAKAISLYFRMSLDRSNAAYDMTPKGVVRIVAVSDIAEGEDVTVSYGLVYWAYKLLSLEAYQRLKTMDGAGMELLLQTGFKLTPPMRRHVLRVDRRLASAIMLSQETSRKTRQKRRRADPKIVRCARSVFLDMHKKRTDLRREYGAHL